MLVFNGKKFARNDAEYASTLSDEDGAAVGFYRPLKKQIKLYNLQREMIGVVTQYGVLAHAKKLECGRYWYSHMTIPEIGENPSYMAHREDVEKALQQYGIARKY